MVALVGDDVDPVFIRADRPVTGARSYPDEREMLRAVAERIAEADPDVLTGWNFVGFDLTVLDRRARELMLTNRVLKAEEARDWGIVNEVVADDDLLERARTIARELAAGPTLAFGAVKTLLNGTFDQTLESQMELEARAIAELSVSADGQEGISAFVEKRKAEFRGE